MLELVGDGPAASTSSTTTACTTCPSRWRRAAVPVVTTLHTPPVPWLESAVALIRGAGTFVAVSEHTARPGPTSCRRRSRCPTAWTPTAWRPGPGGGPAVWSGRIVPEKAPHLAIDAARLAGHGAPCWPGPSSDPAYFDARGRASAGRRRAATSDTSTRRAVRARGLRARSPWSRPAGRSPTAWSPPRRWPVAPRSRRSPEERCPRSSTPAPAGWSPPRRRRGAGPARCSQAAALDRAAVRAHAVQHCSLTRMVDDYERVYRRRSAIRGGRMIGYYVHHVGRGHLHRAQASPAPAASR